VVVVTGVAMTGEREVVGCAVGDTETEAFWASPSSQYAPAAWPACGASRPYLDTD
jgi:hypothetical protein